MTRFKAPLEPADKTSLTEGSYAVVPGPTKHGGYLPCGCEVWLQTEIKPFFEHRIAVFNGVVAVWPNHCKKRHSCRSLTWELPKKLRINRRNSNDVVRFLATAQTKISRAASKDAADLRSQRTIDKKK